jgi:flagellar L-ring protein precursor FlgH
MRESWTADRRGFIVGDIVTVLIDDYTISTAVKENLATDSRTRDLSADVSLPQALSKGAGLTAKNSADQQERGTARRENRFQNEMSVRVVAVGPNGLLQVKGTKSINVDKAAQDIVFTGWVRPQDISSANMVESNRVADAQLLYSSPGALGKPKQGLLSKALGIIWP